MALEHDGTQDAAGNAADKGAAEAADKGAKTGAPGVAAEAADKGAASAAAEAADEPAFTRTPEAGLTADQAARLTAEGKANVDASPKTKTVGQIVAENTFTLFNAINVFLAVLVFITGSYRNMLFMIVVLTNMGIGIFQEVRSKAVIDKLSILARRPVRVRRDGEVVEVPSEAIVLGDLVLLSHGDQVPADLVVREGNAVMNESLLTGESRPVPKGPGDRLMSGSFVVSGSVVGQAVAVGAESYANRINAEARVAKPVESEILSTLRFIIKLGTWVLLPVGAALFLRSFLDGHTVNDSILTTVAAVVGMIPQGLVLLTSSVLAISTMRLARQKVLVQQLYCIEELARVDVLCLDKTGTITTGAMSVEALLPAAGESEEGLARALVTVMAANAEDANETARAVLAYQADKGVEAWPVARAVPFSSDRKYSGCVTADGRCLVAGAVQFVFPGRPDLVDAAARKAGATARLLAVAEVAGFSADNTYEGEPRFLGSVAIADTIRPTAHETLRFFQEQGVTLNVISGDDPRTVSAIAAEAGVPHAEDYVDATTLDTPDKIADAARRYHVFGRVTPQQKRDLVIALKRDGHTVAMTGDGVNDVLALREADCSVAMASGSDAARTVAEIVLVDNDFAHMPAVVDEGRRSINNLQRSAALFLEKTVFSMVVAVLCILFPPYPLLPIQMSLVSTAAIGIPSFVLALEPNHDRVRGKFLANVLSRSMPASVGVSVALACVVLARGPLGLTAGETSTLATVLAGVVGLALVWCISRPFNLLRSALFVFVSAWIVLGVTIFGPFFEVARISAPLLVFMVVVGAASLAVFAVLYRHAKAVEGSPQSPYVRFADLVEKRNHARDQKR